MIANPVEAIKYSCGATFSARLTRVEVAAETHLKSLSTSTVLPFALVYLK